MKRKLKLNSARIAALIEDVEGTADEPTYQYHDEYSDQEIMAWALKKAQQLRQQELGASIEEP